MKILVWRRIPSRIGISASVESKRTAGSRGGGATDWAPAGSAPRAAVSTRTQEFLIARLSLPDLGGGKRAAGVPRVPDSPLAVLGNHPGEPAGRIAPVGFHRALGGGRIAPGDGAD